jgi:hypothetical protein
MHDVTIHNSYVLYIIGLHFSIKNDDESSLVAESNEISNMKLIENVFKILEFLETAYQF